MAIIRRSIAISQGRKARPSSQNSLNFGQNSAVLVTS
jgi:hypothetical protein